MIGLSAVRELVQAPLDVDWAIPRLGRAVWLYLWLLANANASGHVCRVLEHIASSLGVEQGDVERWLARLEQARLVRVQSRPPYLVVKLRFWSSSITEAALNGSKSGPSHREVPVSSSKQQLQQRFTKQAGSSGEDGGVGEGEPLIARLLRSLGQENASEVHELVRHHPQAVIEKALGRVQMTPPSQIRKSKLALFRYLVNRFTNNPDDPS